MQSTVKYLKYQISNKCKVLFVFRLQLRDPQFFQNCGNFNDTSADFVLISADVLLKMTTILKELRVAQLRSKNKRLDPT